MEELVFEDLAPKEVPVKVGEKEYILVEAMADVAVKFKDAMSGEMSVDPETKKVKPGAVHSAEPLAVSLCLFELRQLGIGKMKRIRVPLDTILRWRPAVYQKLFKVLCEMSPGLVQGSESEQKRLRDQEKNLPEDGTDTSDLQPSLDLASTG